MKLKESLNSGKFDPEPYGGFMINKDLFCKTFLITESGESCFNEVNIFLSTNGYRTFLYTDFIEELECRDEIISIYADPYICEDREQIILVISKEEIPSNSIGEITDEILKFRNERDWEQFHNPKDLALAINVEAGELLELFLWKNADDANKEKVKEEIADILIYCLLLSERYGFDVKEMVLDKIKMNSEKYPVDKSTGNAKKYNEI